MKMIYSVECVGNLEIRRSALTDNPYLVAKHIISVAGVAWKDIPERFKHEGTAGHSVRIRDGLGLENFKIL